MGSSARRARGRLDEGAGHRHPLLLAAGERARAVVAALGQAQLVEQRLRAPPRLRRAAARAMSSGIITFSRAVNSGSRWWNWKTKPEGAVPERAQRGPRRAANTSSPPTVTVPASGRSRVPSTCSSVDFPTPEAPDDRPASRPRATSRSSPSQHGHVPGGGAVALHRRPRATISGVASFVAQRFRGVERGRRRARDGWWPGSR